MAKDLDNWLCNMYFQIEKVNLMDIKADPETDKLYFSPVFKMAKKKKQQDQLNKLKNVASELNKK